MRIILTGFADMGAIIEAINDGHVYAYIAKPWEPDHLKQVMKQAVNHHQLTLENERLLTELKHANVFLGAIMDHLDTGALAMDASGVIQAANRAARAYLALEGDPLGKPLERVLRAHDLRGLTAAIDRLAGDAALNYDEADVSVADRSYRVRVAVHNLADASGETFGRVVLLREISHEPFRRDFERLMARIVEAEGELRPILESARDELRRLGEQVERLHLDSAGVGELTDRLSRARTAIENWLDVDDSIAQQSYPDAQLLQARMRVGLARWPMPDRVPERVRQLAQQVEEYYESGENPQRHVL
jgi:PAS domain-containing protein